MIRTPIAIPIAALLLALTFGGCASTPAGHSLQSMHTKTAQRLAADCFWQHEGERLVFGSSEVFSACQRWAHRQVRVTFPGPDR
ncbi:MAG: hypothetical protein ACNA7W_12700 [Pseudomonadales bacterium]